jgi:NADH-quinone oxidoreductase subunit J
MPLPTEGPAHGERQKAQLMALQAVFFYLFAFVAVASAFMVISARNPVHSVLFLILTFFNAAGLFLLTGAEFLAIILLVVYVGAVAVLFLFVVMLDIDFASLRSGVLEYAPVGALVGLILAFELIVVLGGATFSPEIAGSGAHPMPDLADRSNTAALGDVLYTDYIYFFQIAGLILLVAMIGAIVLTLRHRENIKRQDISAQVARTPATAIEVVKVKPGQGV